MQHPPTPPLDTRRLRLRPLAASDAPDLFDVFHEVDSMRYWHTPVHVDVDATRVMIGDMLRPPAAHWWSVRESSRETVIGLVGFLGTGTLPGFGYAMHDAFRRRGYAAEAAGAALDFGFRELALDRVELWIHEDNAASLKVAARLGFTRRGCFRQMYPREGRSRETQVYGLERSNWSHARAQEPSRPLFYGVQPVLEVVDVERSIAFYRDGLGFSVEYAFGTPPTHAMVFRGEWSTQGVRLQLARTEPERTPRPATLYVLAGPGLDKLHSEYGGRGVEIAETLATWPWGRREFAVRDPDGHLLRFSEPT